MTDSKVPNILGSVGLVAKRQYNSITKDFVQSEESSTVNGPKRIVLTMRPRLTAPS